MRRLAVRAIIAKDDKLFLVRQKSLEDGTPNDYYCTIGGGVDDNEDIITALKREVMEEVGVVPVIGKAIALQQYDEGDRECIELFFHVTNYEDFENIDLTSTSHGHIEIEEVGFFDPQAITVKPTFIAETSVAELLSLPELQVRSYL